MEKSKLKCATGLFFFARRKIPDAFCARTLYRNLHSQEITTTVVYMYICCCLFQHFFCLSLNFESSPGRNHFGAEIVLMCGTPHLPHLFTGMSLARPIGLKAGLGTKIEPAGPFITTHWNELQFQPCHCPLSWNALEGPAKIFGARPALGGPSPYIIALIFSQGGSAKNPYHPPLLIPQKLLIGCFSLH